MYTLTVYMRYKQLFKYSVDKSTVFGSRDKQQLEAVVSFPLNHMKIFYKSLIEYHFNRYKLGL